MKYFLLAGEASGDLHGSSLIRAMKEEDSNFSCKAWGGDLMQSAGADVVKHIRELAFMGFAEVILHLPQILRNFTDCKEEILNYKPDAVILIDYPGFNLRIARFCKQHRIPVFYYVSPTVWAWKKSRMFQIRDDVNRLFVILPFEKEFYAREGIEVDYFGHPLVDQLAAYNMQEHELHNRDNQQIIALLPGSRLQELKHSLPIFNKLPDYFPDYRFMLAAAPSIPQELYSQYINHPSIQVQFNKTYDILRGSRAAVVTSGTATLETALLGVPQVVVYKTSPLSYAIGKKLVNIQFISLVNLMMNQGIVKELLQDDFCLERIREELNKLLNLPAYSAEMKNQYKKLAILSGEPGVNKKIAARIRELLVQD